MGEAMGWWLLAEGCNDCIHTVHVDQTLSAISKRHCISRMYKHTNRRPGREGIEGASGQVGTGSSDPRLDDF